MWWVNQGQSWPVELALGVLWAPLRGRAGQRVHHFERLTALAVGDTVVHYAGSCIVAVSEVTATAVQSERPYEPDGRVGWVLRVRVSELDRYVPLHEISKAARVAAAGPGAAFDSDGGVGNGYVFTLPNPALSVVLDVVGLRPAPGTTTTDQHGGGCRDWFGGDRTDGRRVGSYRLEQPLLRRALLRGRLIAPCDFCGRVFPVALLATAHIKPRARCSFEERTDLHIAVLACVLGCDALFEHGYITVDTATGMIRGRHANDSGTDLGDVIGDLAGRKFRTLTRHNVGYFRWHDAYHGHRSEQAGLVLVDAGEGAADSGSVPSVGEEHSAELT